MEIERTIFLENLYHYIMSKTECYKKHFLFFQNVSSLEQAKQYYERKVKSYCSYYHFINLEYDALWFAYMDYSKINKQNSNQKAKQF